MCESCLHHAREKENFCCDLRNAKEEGKRIEEIFGKLDPKTEHHVNPTDSMLYDVFSRIEVRLRDKPDATVMFCYSGHGVEFSHSLHALLTTNHKRSLFPMEKMLNRLAKRTNVFAIFNCNRMYA